MKNRELTHGFRGVSPDGDVPAPHVDKGRNSDYHAFGNSVIVPMIGWIALAMAPYIAKEVNIPYKRDVI